MKPEKKLSTSKHKKKTAVSLVRSSAAEYLTFVAASGQGGVEALYADENVWLTQKMLGSLYEVETHTVNYHLKQIFADRELLEDSVIRNFRITAADGKTYDTQHYNLAAIIAVGYKVNSERVRETWRQTGRSENRLTQKPVRAGIFVACRFQTNSSSVGATSSGYAAPDGAGFVFAWGSTNMPRLRRLKLASRTRTDCQKRAAGTGGQVPGQTCQRQGRCVNQPRVARHALPWEHEPKSHQPRWGCSQSADGKGRCNPVGVGGCYHAPRVGACALRQPWADGWNAVGVRDSGVSQGGIP